MIYYMTPGIVNRVFTRAADLGINKAELGRRVGVTAQIVNKWRVSGSINIRHLIPLGKALGCTVEWLLLGGEIGGPVVDAKLLEYVIGKVRELEDATEARIRPDRYAQLVELLYEEGLRGDAPAEAEVSRLMRLVS